MLRILLVVVGVVFMSGAMAAEYDKSPGNLMVVLRESEGINKVDEGLKHLGPARATLPDGKEVEVDVAWYGFIGDMQIRFVFDGPSSMRNLTSEEFAALNLTPEQAVKVAVQNIERVYGLPSAVEWSGPVMLVEGKSPDLDSSYFLDREFWRGLLKKYPEGLVVGVPKRGGLLFVPASNQEGVEGLRKTIGALYETSENMRVSSALYLFKDDKWSVFQPPASAK